MFNSQQLSNRLTFHTKVLDKFSIKTQQTIQTLYLCLSGWSLKINQPLDLPCFRMNSAIFNDMAQYLDLCNQKLTLCTTQFQIIWIDQLDYLFSILNTLQLSFTKHNNIIDVNKAFYKHNIFQNTIHHTLKNRWRIFMPEWHHRVCECSAPRYKR